MSSRFKRFASSTAFLRAVLITGVILLVLACFLIYFLICGYSGSENGIDSKKNLGIDENENGIENLYFKWKSNAKVINIGDNKLQKRMVYYGTHEMDKDNENIKRIVFTIHGLGRNAAASFEYANIYYKNIIDQEGNSTAIFAPNYTGKKWQRLNFKKVIKWNNDWPTGAPPKEGDDDVKIAPGIDINSFNVLDFLTYKALNSFKNAYEIVYIGFSAGSQMLQRYLSTSPYIFDLWSSNFYISAYLVSPGDYMYYNHLRANFKYRKMCESYKSLNNCMELALTKKDFWEVPKKDCGNAYNTYKYGVSDIDKATPYVSRKAALNVLVSSAYLKYPVTYFVGTKDIHTPRSKTCAAMLQGSTRIQRLLLFYSHIKFLYVTAPHNVAMIPHCQHNEHCIGTSPTTSKFFFPGPITTPDRSSDLNPFKRPYWQNDDKVQKPPIEKDDSTNEIPENTNTDDPNVTPLVTEDIVVMHIISAPIRKPFKKDEPPGDFGAETINVSNMDI